LEDDANGAEDRHRETNIAGRHAHAASEAEGERGGVGGVGRGSGVVDGGGEVDEPDVVEGSAVAGDDAVGEKGVADVGGENAAEGELGCVDGVYFLGLLWWGGLEGGHFEGIGGR